MTRRYRFLPRAGLAAAALALAACSPTVTVHGYVPPEAELAAIKPGVDTVATVEEQLGRPVSTGLLDNSDWYYVQSTMEQLTYNPPRVTDRKVVAVSFNDAGVVDGIDTYTLEDGRIVPLYPKVTPAAGTQSNTIRQIFAGLLNFDATNLLR